MQIDTPRIKKAVLTQKIAIAIDEPTKSDYELLKAKYGIDVAECVRRALRGEIERLKMMVADHQTAIESA